MSTLGIYSHDRNAKRDKRHDLLSPSRGQGWVACCGVALSGWLSVMRGELSAQTTSSDVVAAAFANWNLDGDRGNAFRIWYGILDSNSVTGVNYID